ncbi:unnamed protein product [Pieris brassicae]|uniref:Uncharacterized protein n=1 Tax=Pieris brassicae TaxID=7116 RepID=A0A9P0TDA0_PIEBR|nr:unnamed protein product [Pieris brassicae]
MPSKPSFECQRNRYQLSLSSITASESQCAPAFIPLNTYSILRDFTGCYLKSPKLVNIQDGVFYYKDIEKVCLFIILTEHKTE